MGAFGSGKKVPKGDPGRRGFGTKMAKYLDAKELRCISERRDGVECVLAHGGVIAYKNKKLYLVDDSGSVLFSCVAEHMNSGELMSLEGVVIDAVDAESGKMRHMIAYYKYWRPLD